MVYRLLLVGALILLFMPAAPTGNAQQLGVNALAEIVFSGGEQGSFGVYLGHGLVLTNWHPWTLDGTYYIEDNPPLAPSRSVLQYDADGTVDPGENLLEMADCGSTWVPAADAGSDCVPFTRLSGASFRFSLADDTLIPIKQLVYASRQHDIALLEVDALAVEALGVKPVHLSMIPTWLRHPITIVYQHPDGQPATAHSTLQTGTPTLLPESEHVRLTGPWRVPSLVTSTLNPVPAGSPVFCQTTGDLVGLTWRSGEAATRTWVTPTALWYHDLYAANDELQHPALAAVLADASSAPVDGPTTLDDPLTVSLGNGGIDVQHYDLTLQFNLERGTLSGAAVLDIRTTIHNLLTFSLDSAGLKIEQVTVNGVEVPFIAKEQKLIIQLPDAVPYGTLFTTTITYQAVPAPMQSAYLPFYEIGMFMEADSVFTVNQPDAAHTWFPCNDHPSDRATYDFHIRVAPPLDAVANGQLVTTTLHADNTQTYHWRMSAPMATYLAVVAVADYIAIEDQTPDGILLRHYVYPDKVAVGEAVFGYTDEALVMLEDLFGPYPYNTYGHVVAPLSGMALETQTMTIMPDDVLTMSEQDIYVLMVHELAHQWFGNTVTPATWADIWLNEGFATYAEWLGLNQRYGPQAALAARSLSEQSLITDTRITPLMAPAPAEMLGIASYDKGAWLLHMLRAQIGDDTFFTLLRTYADTFRDRPAASLDFWRLANEVSGQDLDWFFNQWLLQGGLPRYTLYWSGADLLLCADTPHTYRLDLPLRFAGEGQQTDAVLSVETTQALASFTLDFAPATLFVDPDQAILAQVQLQPIAELPETCPPPGD